MSKRRSKFSNVKALPYVGLAVLALITFAVVAFALTANTATTSPSAGQSTFTPKPIATPTPKKIPVAAFLGDSYTAREETDPVNNYVGILSNRMGWKAVPLGQGGTGYTNPGQAEEHESVYLDRVPKVIAAKPDIVIVQGSTNDGRAGEETKAAAAKVYAALKSGLPEAKIVVMGPLAPPASNPVSVGRTRDALSSAAAEAGLPFIDPAGQKWLLPGDGIFGDGIHPNLDGHRQISELLAAALTAAGVKAS